MSIRRRLEQLEERVGEVDGNQEEHIRREALGRVTDDDLELIWEYLKRTEEEEGEPTPEEWAAIVRYEELREKVRHELRASHH